VTSPTTLATRVDRTPVDEDLVVQMGPGRTTRRTRAADPGPGSDLLPSLHVELREVSIEAVDPVPVVDDDCAAVPTAPTSEGDSASGGRPHRRAAPRPRAAPPRETPCPH